MTSWDNKSSNITILFKIYSFKNRKIEVDTVEYPELYTDALSEALFFKRVQKLMTSVMVHDFSIEVILRNSQMQK